MPAAFVSIRPIQTPLYCPPKNSAVAASSATRYAPQEANALCNRFPSASFAAIQLPLSADRNRMIQAAACIPFCDTFPADITQAIMAAPITDVATLTAVPMMTVARAVRFPFDPWFLSMRHSPFATGYVP